MEILYFFVFCTLCCANGKFGSLSLRKASCNSYATQHSLIIKCMLGPYVFPYSTNSDMDYRISNVRTWSFLGMCVHTGSWAHRQRVSTTLLTWKNSHKLFLCSWHRRGSNLGSLDLESDALPTEPPRHPDIDLCIPAHTTFSDLDHISKKQQHETESFHCQ